MNRPPPPIPGVPRGKLPSVREEVDGRAERLSLVTAPGPVSAAPPPEDKALRVKGRGWSIAVPAAFVTALAPLLVAASQHFLALEREIVAMRTAFAGQQERFVALEQAMATQAKEAAELRSTVARLSGYLEGALGAAGVKVKAEAGATAVDVQTDAPASAARRPQIRVTTPVPAPKPR